PIILPPEFRTEEGLLKYKDSIEFDAYKKWRAKNCHCEFFGEVRSAKSDDCITSYPSIMFDPLTTTWFIHFVTFMSQDPLQIHLGRVYKFGKKLDQFDVFDFLKSFQITIKFNNTNMVWSNGMEDNKIVHLYLGELLFYTYLHRDELPDIRIPKIKRPKKVLLPIKSSVKVTDFVGYVYGYEKEDR